MINVSKQGKVIVITLNRPEKKNALTAQMYASMAEAINEANQSPEIKAMVFKGHEGFFTAGNDLADFLANPNMDEESSVYQFLKALLCSEIPMIAAIEGFAVGVGTTMLLHFDYVFASKNASFSMPFVNLGLAPEACASLLLPRLVGYQRAAKWLMTGDAFDVNEAYEAGLVGEVTEAGMAELKAMEYAMNLAQKPRSSLAATKRLMRRSEESMVARLHAELDLFMEGLQGPAAKEAMTAFMEKRPADFSNF